MKLLFTFFSFLLLFFPLFSQDQAPKNVMEKAIKSSSISGQYFMGYYFNTETKIQNFTLKRGYFTVSTKLNDALSLRYTQDITLDKEGSDAGNIEIRLKYLYLKVKTDGIPFLKNGIIEIGMVHKPWLTFEQHINQYRVQGRMYAEKYGIIGSADFGITYIGLFGGKMNSKYIKEVNSKDVGKYGSFAIGVFNGGGYHSVEMNNNKTIETRISLRPFPDLIPGFQLTHGFAYGKGNLASPAPDFSMNIFMLSSESKYHKVTAQYLFGKGNAGGSFVYANGLSMDTKGYSFFGELFLKPGTFSLFSRYDHFQLGDLAHYKERTFINGFSYRFLKNKILIDHQRSILPGENLDYFELALEIAF